MLTFSILLSACNTLQRFDMNSDPSKKSESIATANPSLSRLNSKNDNLISNEISAISNENKSHQNHGASKEQEKNLFLNSVQNMLEPDKAPAALVQLDTYDEKWGKDPQSQLLRAELLLMISQIDQAEKIYFSLLETHSEIKNGPVWYGLGKAAIERGDLKSATNRFEKTIQLDPLNIKAYSDLGIIYLLEGHKELSYNTLNKANQLAGDDDTTIMANLALWGLVFDDFRMAADIAERLKWSDVVRNQLMSKANLIKRRLNKKENIQQSRD
jgi:Flp pilus assembly protein TadD